MNTGSNSSPLSGIFKIEITLASDDRVGKICIRIGIISIVLLVCLLIFVDLNEGSQIFSGIGIAISAAVLLFGFWASGSTDSVFLKGSRFGEGSFDIGSARVVMEDHEQLCNSHKGKIEEYKWIEQSNNVKLEKNIAGFVLEIRQKRHSRKEFIIGSIKLM